MTFTSPAAYKTSHRKIEVFLDDSYSVPQIAVIGYQDSLFVFPLQTIFDEANGNIHIGAFLLELLNACHRGFARLWINSQEGGFPHDKVAVNDLEVRYCLECSQIRSLALGLTWVMWQGMKLRREISNLSNLVFGKKLRTQTNQIQPPEGSISQRTIIEIKAVDIKVGFHAEVG